MTGKEITSVQPERTKPALIEANGKMLMPGGRWNHQAMATFIIGRGNWIKIGELAKIGCGSNTIPNKKRVRARLSALFFTFLQRGEFLAIEYAGDYNAATAVKVADLTVQHDRDCVIAKLDRMRQRKEMTEQVYQRTVALLASKANCNGGDEG